MVLVMRSLDLCQSQCYWSAGRRGGVEQGEVWACGREGTQWGGGGTYSVFYELVGGMAGTWSTAEEHPQMVFSQ